MRWAICVICLLCKKDFAYHRISSSLAYHINAKHPVASAATANVSRKNVSNLASHSTALHQSKLQENTPRMSKSAIDRLTNVLAKWKAIDCRPINIVEDKGFTEMVQTASNEPSYKPPCRTTVTTKISKMYDAEKEKQTWDFGDGFDRLCCYKRRSLDLSWQPQLFGGDRTLYWWWVEPQLVCTDRLENRHQALCW